MAITLTLEEFNTHFHDEFRAFFFRHEDIGNYELSKTFALHLKSYSAIKSFRKLIYLRGYKLFSGLNILDRSLPLVTYLPPARE